MRLIPLNVATAIAGLLRAADKALTIPSPAIELSQDGTSAIARVRFEVTNVRIVLRQLRRLFEGGLVAIPAERRARVRARHLAAVLGESILALDQLSSVLIDRGLLDRINVAAMGNLPFPRINELAGALASLEDFRTSIWLTLNILQSAPDLEVIDNLASLDSAVSSLLGGEGKIARRVRDSSVFGVSADLRLSDVETPSAIVVPICARDLRDGSQYEFGLDPLAFQSNRLDRSVPSNVAVVPSSPEPSIYGHCSSQNSRYAYNVLPSSEPSTVTYSCGMVFRLPRVTEAVILELFYNAIAVSRFADFDLACVAERAQPSPNGSEKLGYLSFEHLRELCIDIYDELVRKNIWDKRDVGGGNGDADPHLMPTESFSQTRNQSRATLADISDAMFLNLLSDMCAELQKRCDRS